MARYEPTPCDSQFEGHCCERTRGVLGHRLIHQDRALAQGLPLHQHGDVYWCGGRRVNSHGRPTPIANQETQ